MKTRWLLVLVLLGGIADAAEQETLSLQLTRKFDAFWDKGDRDAMYDFLDVDCVYKTPFRTEIGREQVRDHVFRNMKVKFRDSVSTESYSKVEGDMAYGIGITTFNEYDDGGVFKARWTSRYLNIFTRKPGGDWKLRFHIVHEDDGKKH